MFFSINCSVVTTNISRGIPVIHTDISCKWWCLRGGACAQQICCPPENEITKGHLLMFVPMNFCIFSMHHITENCNKIIMIITKGCPTGWKKFHLTGKCYKLIMDGVRTFWDASNNCKKLAQSYGSTTVYI